jgi:hypothetical protein
MQKWGVVWSCKFQGVITSIEFDKNGIAISNNNHIEFMDYNGNKKWKIKMPFKPYKLHSNKGLLGVLMGNGFIVIDTNKGEQLHEGRSTQGGFSQIISRPGGGWILSDRHEQLHIFNQEGLGIKRLFSGKIRKLIGWLNREHLIIHDGDGCLRCLRLMADSTQRQIEEKIWSWASTLNNGELLLKSLDGTIWTGRPNSTGWDNLSLVIDDCFEPLNAIWTNEQWWIMDMNNKIHNIITQQEFVNLGHIIASNSNDVFAIANNEGLLRIIESADLIKKRNELISFEYDKIKHSLNSEERQNTYKLAKNAEMRGDHEKANELYNSLGIEYNSKQIISEKEGIINE